MSNPSPASLALLDQLDAATKELKAYVNGLDAPELLAELRCTLGRMIPALADAHGPMSPFVTSTLVITEGLARFDLNAPDTVTDPGNYVNVLPMAVAAAEECACDTKHGGIRQRIATIHDLTHQLMHHEGHRP